MLPVTDFAASNAIVGTTPAQVGPTVEDPYPVLRSLKLLEARVHQG